MEQIKLEHLAPYLPYKLKCTNTKKSYLQTGEDRTGVLEQLSILENDDCVIMGNSGYFLVHYSEIKPILRPLSDLANELDINGLFIPIVELADLNGFTPNQYEIVNENDTLVLYGEEFFNQELKYCVRSFFEIDLEDLGMDKGLESTMNDEPFSDGNNYPVFAPLKNHFESYQKLFEWHFDVFGLIEKGLAIDINTIKK